MVLGLSLAIAVFLCVCGIGITTVSTYADTALVAAGDFGCKTNAKTNLGNIAKDDAANFLGLGDYLYNCSSSDVKRQWDNIKQEKHGVVGNHDDEKASSLNWMRNNLGLGLNGWFSWKINDIAIIGVNVYKDYEEGSLQHAYLERKTTQFCGRDDSMFSPINWVIYAFHEPIQTPTVGGGHGLNKALRNVIEPLAESCGDNVLILEAHNHISAVGNVQGNNHALCGGGGQGGDSLGNLNGFEWGTEKFGYCHFNFLEDSIEFSFIGLDGTKLTSHTFVN